MLDIMMHIFYKFKDRNILNAKSERFRLGNNIALNQYFNFELISLSDILEVYLIENDIFVKDKKVEINISNLFNCQILKSWYSIREDCSVLLETQLVPPNVVPFSQCSFDPNYIYIQILEGENLDDDYFDCNLKLNNDILSEKIYINNTCQNPRSNKIIKLPIHDTLSKNLEIIFAKSINIKNIHCFKPILLNINEIFSETSKKIIKYQNGKIYFLVQKGKSNITPFSDYIEIEEKKFFKNLEIGIKVIEANNFISSDICNSNIYCSLKLAGIEQKTRKINGTSNPKWNKTFYFDIPSYSTNELSLKIIRDNKEVISEKIIPIKDFKCGIIEDKWYDSFHLITHIIEPGKPSFEENPFSPFVKIINIQNLSFKPNVFCQVKLKNDEYWRYTKSGNFSDYFTFEYVNNSILCFKSSNLKNNSEEKNIDLTQNEEKIINNALGQFKISFIDEIKPFSSVPFWKCNIFVKKITDIVKKEDTLWSIEINNNSLGFTYDGNINKYISIDINSLQSDEIKFILYKHEKDSKKEYAEGTLKIFGIQIGIIEEKNISLLKKSLLSSNYLNNNIELNLHITPPNYEPYVNLLFNPLIMHIYVIEAINVPKVDLTSKTDPFVVLRFEKDKKGLKTKYLSNTSTPQWNELLNLIITDSKEKLIVEIWDKDVTKDKIINSIKLDIEKYLDEKPHFEWIQIDKMHLNLGIHIKPLGESFLTQEEVNEYQLNSSLPIIK